MRIFLQIIMCFLPFYAQASVFDSLFSDDEAYIETTKGIDFDDAGTIEDISISVFEGIYFYDNNDFPNMQKLTAAAIFSNNNKNIIHAIESMQFGNVKPFKEYLKSKNLNVAKITPEDIVWEIEGNTKEGKMVLAKYQNYVICIDTTDDGDYVSASIDDIYMRYNGSTISYDEIQESMDLSSAIFYAALLNDRINP